ncbi:AAA family ATPase [Selenomonas sp. KH1T6]|uniref:AAA family ATPase n=1 Tax=Selenomonas sp. KH1T6 TaxID=3158784 RepID=UPI0008A7D1B8|nr:PD-(D/E)XK nuclease superfamily protein [Selenomonas ruminantium]
MKQHYVMPVGVDDFRRVRERYYYVDKTDFIRKLIDGHAQVTLITRPRRFGKTLAMSMLYYFFSSKDAETNRVLFEGTGIEQAGERYMEEQGTRPVIFLSLKDIKQSRYTGMVQMIGSAMQDLYYEFSYLMEGDALPPHEKKYFQSVLDRTASEVDLQLSLKKLTIFLSRYHKKPVLVLIDEYDAPIQSAWDHGYYGEAIDFVRNYLSAVLKSNPNLDFAVLTGVLRIAKESIFSSLNNLKVASVAGGGFEEVMGFNQAEIEQMAADFNVPEKYKEIKAWYDGYNFSGKAIFNPWSVVSYFDHDCLPEPYWVNTSGNTILGQLLRKAEPEQVRDLYALLNGGSVRAQLVEGAIYTDIGKSSRALYSMMLNTGYLTVAETPRSYAGARTAMRIPNMEIRLLFQEEIISRLAEAGSDENMLVTITEALLEGRAEDFAASLEKFLRFAVSFYDTANKESFYHGLMLGMLAALVPAFEVLSNRESGYGRFDIAILPKEKETAGALLEFKVAEKEEVLPERAQEALAQIEENAYLTEFENRGVSEVWQYGIAFCGKKCHIEAKS